MEMNRPGILVVEDDQIVSRLMLRWLAGWGWDAVAEPTAAAALQRFERRPFDAALCDVDLPDGDGVALAGALAKLKPALQVVVVSGTPENLDRARAAGFGRVLQKPLAAEALKALLRRD